MTTLQIVTNFSRKVLAIGAMLFIGGLILYFGIKIGFAVKETLHPTPPPPPTVTYGKLPEITFPEQSNVPSFTYTVNTVEGTLPDLGDRVGVYKMQAVQPNLLALSNATAEVNKAGFASDPITVSDTKYMWTNNETPQKSLTVDIQTNNFSLTSSYQNDTTVTQASNVPDHTHALSTVNDFLTSINASPDDLDDSKTKVSLFAITNGVLTPASSISSAQIVRVDLFQKDVDKLPIYYSQPSYSSMNFLLASTDTGDPQIVEAHFFHQDISSDSATYPIKTAQQAVDDLKSGKAYIASYPTDITQVTIRNINLAYYISDTDQQYLMPIIVLQGDNNFFAYDSAVKDEWIGK